ncbi:MAG: DJ-1/PfpI family protein [Actinomycetota bacterium]|nr:DJ-1/PfpI family protein [Actinomycetota bacterium]
MKRKLLFAFMILLLTYQVTLDAGCKQNVQTRHRETSKQKVIEKNNQVLVVIANRDFQDLEYKAVAEKLKSSGFKTVVANSSGSTSTGVGGLRIESDMKITEADPADYRAIVLIGGPGAADYFDFAELQSLVREISSQNRIVAAICIAPVILANAGLLKGKRATCWQSERDTLSIKGAYVQNEPVVEDGLFITGSGPESAALFADRIVNALSKKTSESR